MRLRLLLALAAAVSVALVIGVVGGSASVNLPWQTGMRAVGNGATIEPAVNLTDGTQTFLITPNHSPFYDAGQNPGAPIPPPFTSHSAPLYLVTYPLASTADATAPFNCYTEGFFTAGQPYNCNHAQIPGIKGHDHLVGVPGSQKAGGDFDVAWHVFATFFTGKGVSDGAMNNRILTWNQLKAAQDAGDVTGFVDTGIYFECAAVSGSVYQGGTPLSFAPGQS
jgi:hypothetical protein